MTNSLFQLRFPFNRRWFEITPEGLSFRKKEIEESAETFIRFEEVGVKFIRSTERKRKWLIATLVFLVIAIGMFFYERSGGNINKNAFVVYLVLSAACAIVNYFSLSTIDSPKRNWNIYYINFHLVEKRCCFRIRMPR